MPDRAVACIGRADPQPRRGNASGVRVLHLLFPGDPQSVRRALKIAMKVFREAAFDATLLGVVEIVLAEVLNNVVEHAYATHDQGLVELEAAHAPLALGFRIRDEGAPMPARAAPAGRSPDLQVETDALPEGGFGWFLIRELTEDLRYRRIGNRNELTFRIALQQKLPGASVGSPRG